MDVLGVHVHLWLTSAGVTHVKLDPSSMYHRMATRLTSGSFIHLQPGSDRTLLGRSAHTAVQGRAASASSCHIALGVARERKRL